jgi:hypothetical protein
MALQKSKIGSVKIDARVGVTKEPGQRRRHPAGTVFPPSNPPTLASPVARTLVSYALTRGDHRNYSSGSLITAGSGSSSASASPSSSSSSSSSSFGSRGGVALPLTVNSASKAEILSGMRAPVETSRCPFAHPAVHRTIDERQQPRTLRCAADDTAAVGQHLGVVHADEATGTLRRMPRQAARSPVGAFPRPGAARGCPRHLRRLGRLRYDGPPE